MGQETIVLDLDTSRCHCLSPATDVVWNRLQQEGTTAGFERILQERFRIPQAQAQACLEHCSGDVAGLVSGCSISGTTANVALLGDPLPGTFKELRVTYSCNGGSNQMVRICENALISISC